MLELLLPCIMLVCLFKIKSKTKIFALWIFLYLIPMLLLVYDREQGKLLDGQMDIKIALGIFLIAFIWALIWFAIPIICYVAIIVIKKIYVSIKTAKGQDSEKDKIS